MVKAMLVKMVFNKVMDLIEKASDDKIASNHAKRLVKLEAHMVTKTQHSNILKRLKNLEDKCSKCTK